MSSRFLEVLRSGRRKRVELGDLRRHWLDANPDQLQHPERDALLFAELKDLESQGEVALPARSSFELMGNPRMPKFVTLIDRGAQEPSEDWARIPWMPELGFWTDLTVSELTSAKAINEWLLRRRGKFMLVPVRERSLEIFGDEKYLDLRVRDNALFSGRLPLSTIGAFVVPYPLPYRVADAPGKPVLVVENHHTYWSFGEWNVRVRQYAAVVYGAGKAFCSAGTALQEVLRECRADGAVYFGDLDPTGIFIPLRFNSYNGIAVRPAINLYRMALGHGRQRRGVVRIPGDEVAVQEWLPELNDALSALWASNNWVPQEGLGMEQLFSNWQVDPSAAVPIGSDNGSS